jgi:hypothetical protein
MRKQSALILSLGVALSVEPGAASAAQQTPEELRAKAEVIRPTAEETKWRQVPWVLDLAEGQRVARAERRPMFLWATGDDPLERC